MNSKIQFVLSYFVFSCAAQLISIGSIVAAALGYDGVIKTAIIVGVQAVANLVALTLVNSRAATSTLVPSLGFPFVAIFIAIAAVNSFLSLAWFACWFASLVVAALLTASLTAHVRGFFAEEWQSLNRLVQMAHVASALVAFAASPIMYTYLGLSSIFYTSAVMIVLSFVTFQISCRTYQEKKSIYAPSNTSKIGERSEFDRSNYGFAMNLFYWCTLGLFTVVEVNILKHRFDASPSTISSIFVVAILTSLLTLRVLPLDRLIKNPAYFIFVAAAMACGFSVLYFNTKSIYIVYLSIVGMGIADGCFKLSISMILQQITSETIRLKAFVKQRLAQYLGTLVAVMLLAFFDQGNSPMLLTSIAVGSALMMMVVSSRYRGRLTPAIIIAPIAFVLMPAVGKADVFMVGLPSTPSQLDPSRVTDVSTAAITGQVFDSLYEYTVTNDLVPRLAKKHIISPDGLQIRITLDQTQRFSDGANLRATDVEKSLIRTISILKEESRWAFGNIKGFDAFITGSKKSCEGIRALSEDTIEFKFDRPFPLFLKILATPYFAISKSSSTNQQIGTGEFMIKSRDSGVVILARKNNLEPKKIEFRSYNDASNLVAFDFRIIASDAEMVLFPPEKYESREFNLLQTIILQLNAGRQEFATGDERCRFSAAFAEESAKQYKWSKLSEGLPFWTDFYGKTKLPIASSKKGTKVTILYANSVGHFSTANNDKIRDKLLASGYNIEFKRLDSADLIARMRAKNYTATLWGFLPDYIDPDALLSPLVRSGQQYNWSSFNNKAVDTLLELGGSGLDGIVRKQIYDKVFDAMGKDCRISFLGSEHGRYVVSRKWDFPGLSGLGMLTARFRDVKRRAP